jgi:hypothetical protein
MAEAIMDQHVPEDFAIVAADIDSPVTSTPDAVPPI